MHYEFRRRNTRSSLFEEKRTHFSCLRRQTSAFKSSLRIVAACPFLVRSHGAAPTIQPSWLHTGSSILLHANLNIILRIMALMLSTIHVRAIGSNDRARNSKRPDVQLILGYHLDYFATFGKQGRLFVVFVILTQRAFHFFVTCCYTYTRSK